MSYAIRGNSCNCVTSALTSNAKYIPPLSKVYYDRWTDMWLYPGHTGFNYPFQHPFGPEVLKAWNLESPSLVDPGRHFIYEESKDNKHQSHSHHTHEKPIQQKRKNCANCATHN